MTTDAPGGFVRGNDRLARMLDRPGMREAVAEVHAGMDEMDRAYASGLADIRKAGSLTQKQLADAMKTDQGSVSRIENRDDVLLSTFAEYIEAVGGQNAALVVSINGVEVEMPLDRFRRSHEKPADK